VLEGFAVLITDGHAVAMPILERASAVVPQLPVDDVVRWGFQVGGVRSVMWHEDAIEVYERQARLVREAGALGELPIHLQALALERAWLGDLLGAERLMAESESISAAIGNQVPPFALLRILALQGREAEAAPLIEAVVHHGTARGQGIAVMVAHWAAAVLYNGLGRHEEAAAAAREVVTHGVLPWLTMWARVELVEAAARAGETDLARAALDGLAATTQPAGSDFALGIEARSRALLADGEAAEASYREAIARLGRTRRRPELARAHLLYGEWLRREARLAQARAQLRTAEELFAEIGMDAFAKRARGELAGAGAKPRQRAVEAYEGLTPQEQQIALFARDGLTNVEIGGRLFLSPRTVEWHLHKVFAKLGIRSRRQLRGALEASESELSAT
jgi:ATP/maltotriose-dependent transcriptional regulator MalT